MSWSDSALEDDDKSRSEVGDWEVSKERMNKETIS